MSSQSLKLIAAGLALLLLLWGGSALLSRGSDSVRGALDLHVPAQAGVDTITITKRPDTIVLSRQSATDWTVNGHRAAAGGVTDLFQALGDTARPELVAQDSSSFARLQVDSTGGRWLRLRHGRKVELELIVGTRPTDYQSAYLRRPGDAHVYLWRGRLGSAVDRTLDDWRDKRIAVLAPDSIAAVEVVRGKDRYAVTRSGKAWKVNGASADSGAVARYLDRLKAITASGFATPLDTASRKTSRQERRLAVRSRRHVLLSLAFDSIAGGFVVRHQAGTAGGGGGGGGGGEDATVYRMNAWDVDGVTPTSASLLPPKSTPTTKSVPKK
ncbi:MAG TPA: DUF4340 domain-containing protein [Gemmatimonadales bacterium]|nr:DUF4340 domain-containing protein [Gemmatimonadales bacterium]